MRTRHFVFGETLPDGLALVGTIGVRLGLPLHFVDDCGVDGVERVETFGIELDSRYRIAAGRSNIGHQ